MLTDSPMEPRAMNSQEWRKWKENNKIQKRKWKENKLIREVEQMNEVKKEAEEKKRRKEEEDEQKEQLGVTYTVSIALPGSILDNAQSPELRTYLGGQIARAATIFNISEVVIFDELGREETKTTEGDYGGVGKKGNAPVQMARILQYLECPQYLRKAFFPKHSDLKFAGLLNPLDAPHHVRVDEDSPYREGVVLQKPVKGDRGSFVDAGLRKEVRVDRQLRAGLRVTVRMQAAADRDRTVTKLGRGTVVAPSAPRTDSGVYWGYSVRVAGSFAAVFSESPYGGGYDVLLGTSEKGGAVDDLRLKQKFSHLLVVFGGLQGLEASLDADQTLQADDPKQLFDHYINTCPQQGSSTIRTEEAILITLSALRPKIHQAQKSEHKH